MLGLRLRKLHDSTVYTDPAGFAFAISTRFLLGAVSVAPFSAAFFLADLSNLSIHAAPNHLAFAMRARLFLGAVTLQMSFLSISLGNLADFSVNTDPAFSAAVVTMSACFLFGVEQLSTTSPAFRFC